MTRPDWWDAPVETVVGRPIIQKPAQIPPQRGLEHKAINQIVVLVCVLLFPPLGYISVGDWGSFWTWFVLFGIPFLLGALSPDKVRELNERNERERNAGNERNKQACGQSDTVATVERLQPLEQLRGRLSR